MSSAEIWNYVYMMRITKGLIGLCGCTGWPAPLLFSFMHVMFFHGLEGSVSATKHRWHIILIENNHSDICCLQYQTKMLWGRAQLFLTDPRIWNINLHCEYCLNYTRLEKDCADMRYVPQYHDSANWPRGYKSNKVAKIRNRYNQVPHLTFFIARNFNSS